MIDHRPPSGESAAVAGPSVSTARMADGTLLRTLRWAPAGEPWALALIVHGIAEHAGRYATVAEALTADGIEVHAYDQRGFGESAGQRAHLERWSQLHDDLEERLTALRAEQPELPLILWGHSLGGLIACGYVLSPVPRSLPDLLVLSSPAIDAAQPAWKKSLAGALAGVVPRLRLSNGPVGEGLSRDSAVRDSYANDPLRVGSTTVRFAHEGFREQARVQTALDAIDALPMPTYVFHGSDDPVVPVAASEPLAARRNVTRHVHQGLLHETHHEPEHAVVLAEAVAWIETQRDGLRAGPLGAGPAAAARTGHIAPEV